MFSRCAIVLTIALHAALVSDEFGPRGEVGQVDLPPPHAAIELSPDMPVAEIVRNSPEHAVFLLRKGTYKQLTIVPRTGQSFVGEPGAILDGEHTAPWAFKSKDGDEAGDVRIENLQIIRYAPPKQECAIQGAAGWKALHCEVRESTMGGIAVYGPSGAIKNCHVHHNEQLGIKAGGENIEVTDCEVDHNNPHGRYIVTWEAGGSKFVRTTNLLIKRCSFHDNVGRGIWNDYENSDATIRDNHCFRNTMCGIYHEVSRRALIEHNLCEENGVGYDDPEWVFGAGICVQASDDVTIKNNTVRNNANGITAIATDREGGSPLTNLLVSDNQITMPRGRTGVVWDGKPKSTPWNIHIRFQGNRYEAHEPCFAWNAGERENDFGRAINWKAWQAFGHDTKGTFKQLLSDPQRN